MTLTIDLPDDQLISLSAEAARAGETLAEYVGRLVTTRRPGGLIRTGVDLVAYWRAEGLIGTHPAGADAPAEARRLRDAAQTRTRG